MARKFETQNLSNLKVRKLAGCSFFCILNSAWKSSEFGWYGSLSTYTQSADNVIISIYYNL